MKEQNELKADLSLLSFARENLSLSAFGPIAPPGRERLQQVRQINSIYSVGLLTCLFVSSHADTRKCKIDAVAFAVAATFGGTLSVAKGFNLQLHSLCLL